MTRTSLKTARGLAHFAQSSEQNVPVPLSEMVLQLVLLKL